jgi:hypothetical protein|eukprot:CAMPEP_0174385576 /NCGR_PEP_ID=MMETSP0811_2-20130205/126699_1 /TAXON_ID=73025 ORGANISM="Eutreptiella gymnastica-like, Strain CCMP1594" /NCGR_SAMPLE_ID=MMETSP0811_2 /ASSEMBLY_ACC=CAM_ASM_000667 /LENGTH=264 /DNA_ID=CAMNT_0015539949 /DNA_START=891 /DNA_END=1685 /DNA_ORIENTATION=+
MVVRMAWPKYFPAPEEKEKELMAHQCAPPKDVLNPLCIAHPNPSTPLLILARVKPHQRREILLISLSETFEIPQSVTRPFYWLWLPLCGAPPSTAITAHNVSQPSTAFLTASTGLGFASWQACWVLGSAWWLNFICCLYRVMHCHVIHPGFLMTKGITVSHMCEGVGVAGTHHPCLKILCSKMRLAALAPSSGKFSRKKPLMAIKTGMHASTSQPGYSSVPAEGIATSLFARQPEVRLNAVDTVMIMGSPWPAVDQGKQAQSQG